MTDHDIQTQRNIRAALRDADRKNKLGVVSAVVAIPTARLRELAHGSEFTLIEQMTLAMNLES